ncbi:MAG TPA: TIGR04053 family radical SAM/SPASM domain-containing protein [Chthoniobacteraceae bacterium]|nr:TIGR04053 family radical SAM/SPASM domain-containing protein [Chthoniobacteraceae bacterium]
MIVIWEVTRACALACNHCRAEAIARADPNELNLQEAERFIDQVARAMPKIFILTGGDPMYRRDLVHLIEYATRKGLRVAMSPSATPRFLKADLGVFKDAGLKAISLSLDGASRESHDAFRGVRGTWGWTLQAFRAVRQAGISLQINTTITRRNLGEYNAFVAMLDQLQPDVWSLFQLVPTGRGKSGDLLTGRQMEDLFNRLCDLAPVVPYKIKTTEGMHFRRVALQRWEQSGGARPSISTISDGRGFVFVSHTGEIFPSGFLPISAGNVRAYELIDIYRNAPLFLELRDLSRLKGKCGRCEYRAICGGSRARAYAMTGDYLAEEPLCIYEPKEKQNP